MVATRQDAWSPDDDLLLAEVTLRHIREGGTQLSAFEEVAERLGRTSAACGFRWNSTVRKKYEAAIAIAKAQRQKQKGKKSAKPVETMEQDVEVSAPLGEASLEEEVGYEAMIRFLKDQKQHYQELQRQIIVLETALKEKDGIIQKLIEENEKMKQDYYSAKTVNEDYRALVQIMERARRLAIFNENGEEDKPLFKMDANGNLERVNK